MARGKSSGYTLTTADARVVAGMVARGDRDHDIAAWFGVNQGRIAEVKEGKWGPIEPSPADTLPPKGPPGVKGRRLRSAVNKALGLVAAGKPEEAMATLEEAAKKYDAMEA